MLKHTGKAVLVVVGLVAATYLMFFLPLGAQTLFEHGRDIAETDEARELGSGVGATTDRLRGAVREKSEAISDAVAGD